MSLKAIEVVVVLVVGKKGTVVGVKSSLFWLRELITSVQLPLSVSCVGFDLEPKTVEFGRELEAIALDVVNREEDGAEGDDEEGDDEEEKEEDDETDMETDSVLVGKE